MDLNATAQTPGINTPATMTEDEKHVQQPQQQRLRSSLSLLSSIAMMISEDHKDRKDSTDVDGQVVLALGLNKKRRKLSPKLTRSNTSFVSLNLLTSFPKTEQEHHKSNSSPSFSSMEATSTAAAQEKKIESRLFATTSQDGTDEISTATSDSKGSKGPLETASLAVAGRSKSAPKMSTGININPSNENIGNVYRSYEMELPESSSAGFILSTYTTRTGNGTKIDDYNNDITDCLPLQDPPRLPNPRESFFIAARAREERKNWGWYV